jgi:hypothetical protein
VLRDEVVQHMAQLLGMGLVAALFGVPQVVGENRPHAQRRRGGAGIRLFSALILMGVVTTMMAPILLRRLLGPAERET